MTKFIFSIVFFVFWTNSFTQTSQNDFKFEPPQDLKTLTKLSVWSTQYFIHQFDSKGNIPIVLANGEATNLYADTCDFCKASLEGTAYIKDTLGIVTVINFAKTGDTSFVDCRKCNYFSKTNLSVEKWGRTLWATSSGFGDGVLNFRLLPFRTIAVDKKFIPYGTVLFFPQARGVEIELPNGQKVIHDGYFFAGDTGGAIKENHIDVFTGINENNPFPDIILSNPRNVFDVYIVSNQTIINTFNQISKKK